MHSALELFCKANEIGMDEEGIRIPNAVLRQGDGFTMAAMAVNKPKEHFMAAARLLVKERPLEMVFGLDHYAKPGQGVDTKDFLSVHYWDGSAWRFGVIAYQHKPHRFDPIDWHNPLWCGPKGLLARLMTDMWSSISVITTREPSPAMALPLRVAEAEQYVEGT